MNTYIRKIAFVASMLLASVAFAQEAAQPSSSKPQEVLVRIQQEAAPAPKSATDKTVVQAANEWVDFGKNVGSAMDAGLSALTKNANEFAGTDAGRFTMLVIAWKVAGKDAIGLLDRFTGITVGMSALVVALVIYVWVVRRFFMSRTVVLKKTGGLFSPTRVVEYGLINSAAGYSARTDGLKVISTLDDDDRHAGLFIASAVWLIVSATILATVIF